MKIFARIDHAVAVHSVELEILPTELLIFRVPRGGTVLMNSYPPQATDLQLKTLSREDESRKVWTSFNSPAYLQKRHGLEETPFKTIGCLIDDAIR